MKNDEVGMLIHKELLIWHNLASGGCNTRIFISSMRKFDTFLFNHDFNYFKTIVFVKIALVIEISCEPCLKMHFHFYHPELAPKVKKKVCECIGDDIVAGI